MSGRDTVATSCFLYHPHLTRMHLSLRLEVPLEKRRRRGREGTELPVFIHSVFFIPEGAGWRFSSRPTCPSPPPEKGRGNDGDESHDTIFIKRGMTEGVYEGKAAGHKGRGGGGRI